MNANTKWTFELLHQQALKYKTKKEFLAGSSKAYHSAVYRKIMPKICSHMQTGRKIKWTKVKVLKEALKYSTRWAFQKGNKTAYNAAWNGKYLEQACIHMVPEKETWDLPRLKIEALKYTTRIGFKEGSPCAYRAATRDEHMEEICQHMLPVGNCYNRCVYELRAPGKVYVGLTLDFSRRMRAHRYCKTLGEEGFEAVQLTDYLPVKEAMKIEKQLIIFNEAAKHLESFNKHPGGGLGGGNWVTAKGKEGRQV